MKKILFVLGSLSGGGAEKALINLLNLMDPKQYDITVQLMENRGINLAYLPEHVKLLPDLKSQQWFTSDTKTFVKKAIKKARFGLLVKKGWSILRPRIKRNMGYQYKNFCAWKAIRHAFPKNEEHYDVAVAYIQGIPIYYVLDCVNADRKIGWMHIDYSKIDNVPREEMLEYYGKLDAFVSMSAKCVQELQAAFPSISDKICLLHNLNSVHLIRRLSDEGDAPELKNSDAPVILSIGRLCEQKGYDYAIEAAEILAKENLPFRWYILGAGELEETLKASVKEKGLEDRVFFLGLKSNPYPYIKRADIIAQTSRYEGKSVVLDEAKILKKTILVTNYNSVGDQIEHGKTGYIVEINSQDIARGLKELLGNETLREQLRGGLSNAEEEQLYWLNKHYELFEGN